jgi:hypothetical protein
MVAPSRSETRFVLGLQLDRNIKVVEQVLSTFLTLLQEIQKLDETSYLMPWKREDRNECPPVTESNFPEKLSGFQKYCETFRTTYPFQDKRWYTSFCLNHAFAVSPSYILTDLDEIIKAEGWFMIECAVQTDKKVIEIGWFAYSLKEYASPSFRDVLAELMCIPPAFFALQWQNVKKGAKELWAMTVKAAEGPHVLLDRALGELYSSKCTSWPWGIRMRYVPYAETLNTNNPAVTNIKTIQVKFLDSFKPLILENLRVSLDHSFETAASNGIPFKVTVREAIMGINSPRKGKKGEALKIIHGVVEYNDRRFGRRVVMVPYPTEQVGTTLGLMMAQHPYTILSHFLQPESIQPLFLTHAVEAESGATYDAKTDSLRTPAIMELEQSMVQDAVVFDFDLKLVEKDRIQAEKKRKFDGQLVKRLDDSSIGTLRAESPTAAGSSKSGTRPSS